MQDSLLTSWGSFLVLCVFCLAYVAVIFEQQLGMLKSKPVVLASGIVWATVGFVYYRLGHGEEALHDFEAVVYDFTSLFLFLLSAMTFLNTLRVLKVFDVWKDQLLGIGLGPKSLFWLSGIVSFFVSAIADNLTTALLFGHIILVLLGEKQIIQEKARGKYLVLSFVNLVVAANAGGAFSPFGDITTLMLWQASILHFSQFFPIFLPSLINWLVPAFLLYIFLPKQIMLHADTGRIEMLPGAMVVLALFGLAITFAVVVKHIFHMPPVLGMVTGLGTLQLYAWYVTRFRVTKVVMAWGRRRKASDAERQEYKRYFMHSYNVYANLEKAEWDTLMFFYGVVLCVGGLAAFGQLDFVSQFFYGELGPTLANILTGIISSVVDNIPIMYSVISMHPHMSIAEWQLVTLTVGVGGSLFAIGSAPGVALMGQARGVYTFFAHLRWTWTVAVGYAVSIAVQLFLHGI